MSKEKKKKSQKPPKKTGSAKKSLTAEDIVQAGIDAIIEKGRKRGYLTYEEMNEELPDEAVTPNRLDNLLMTLDEMGVNLLDEADLQKQKELELPDQSFDEEQKEELEDIFGS